MNDKILSGFLDDDTEEVRKARQEAIDKAESDQRTALKTSGTYLMEVATFAFKDQKTGEMRTSPEVYISELKKSLILSLNLRVVDGTPKAPKGASIFERITLSPAKGADIKKIQNTMRMLKPRIVALTGESKIQITTEWIEDHLMAKFEETPEGEFKLIKDHKMKNKVMVTFEDDEYMGEPKLKMISIRKAEEGDKSISSAQVESKGKETATDGDIDPDEALVTGKQVETPVDKTPEAPTVADDF